MNRQWFTLSLLLLIFIHGVTNAKDQVAWVDDLTTAAQLAASRNQLVLIHFTADWCGPCQRLEKKVFSQQSFGSAVSQGFVPVKINVTQHPEIAQKFSVTAWPTDLLMTPDGKELHRMVSPQSMETYLATLRQVSWRHANSAGIQEYTASALPPRDEQSPSSQIAGPLATQLAERFGGRQNVEIQQAQFMQRQSPGSPAAMTSAGAQQPFVAANSNIQPNPPQGRQQDQNQHFAEPAISNRAVSNQSASFDERPGDSYHVANNSRAAAALNTRSEPVAHMINNTFVAVEPAATQPNPVQAAPATAPATTPNGPQQTAASAVTDRAQSAVAETASQFAPTAQRASGTLVAPNRAVETASLSISPSNSMAAVNQSTQVDESSGRSASTQAAEATVRLGLDGYCPVTLLEEDQWTVGDKRWGAKHRGSVYLFKSAAAQQMFLANPDRFSPMLAGYDPVLFCEKADYVIGDRMHGIRYKDTIVLFASEQTLEEFSAAPDQYVSRVQQALSAVSR